MGGQLECKNVCNWMIEYIEPINRLEEKSPMLFKRGAFTAIYCELKQLGFIFVIGGFNYDGV